MSIFAFSDSSVVVGVETIVGPEEESEEEDEESSDEKDERKLKRAEAARQNKP